MQIKVHQAYRTIIALADTELIGQKFEEGIRQIDVRTNFFQGDEKSKEEIIKLLQFYVKEDASFNIVGQESVQTALEAGIIDKDGIIRIQKIPIALVLL